MELLSVTLKKDMNYFFYAECPYQECSFLFPPNIVIANLDQ